METAKPTLPGKLFNIVVVAVLSLMVVLVFVNAVLRYAFNSGIPAGEELSRYLFIWISCLGTIAAYREGKHIGVDLLINALRGTARRTVELIAQVIVFATFVLVLWGGWGYFVTSAASPGPATEIPFGFVSASIMVTALSILVMTVLNIVKLLKPQADEAGAERKEH